MTTIVKEVYDAFIEAGTSPETAQGASSALIEHRAEFETMKADIKLLKWMVTYLVALSTSLAVKFLLAG
jgi:hypothetical protein